MAADQADTHDREVDRLRNNRLRRHENETDVYAAGDESASEHDAAVSKDIGKVRAGFDEELEHKIALAARGAADPEAAAEAARGLRASTFADVHKRVGGDTASQVTDALLEKGVADALNAIREVRPTRIEAKVATAKTKVENATEQAVNLSSHQVGPAYDDAARRAILNRVAHGQPIAEASAAIEGQMVGHLAGDDRVAPENRAAVARKVVGGVRDAIQNKISESGQPPRQAATAMFAAERAKQAAADSKAVEPQQAAHFGQQFQNMTGANDARSMTAGNQVAADVAKGQQAEAAMARAVEALASSTRRNSAMYARLMNLAASLKQVAFDNSERGMSLMDPGAGGW